jgi:hypothetical protein
MANPDAALDPQQIISGEIRRAKPALKALGISFSVSHSTGTKKPFFACCYDIDTMEDVNIVAFYAPVLSDWDLMEKDATPYRGRIRAGIREEVIHAVQVITVRDKYRDSTTAREEFPTAEGYYDNVLGKIIGELGSHREGEKIILNAARLYYEDWTIDSMNKLADADKKGHGRQGYMANELIRQLVQINLGEPTSEEAKGKAWDKHRIFDVGECGTTLDLLKSMSNTLRQSAEKAMSISPTLKEAIEEVEATLARITKKKTAERSASGEK